MKTVPTPPRPRAAVAPTRLEVPPPPPELLAAVAAAPSPIGATPSPVAAVTAAPSPEEALDDLELEIVEVAPVAPAPVSAAPAPVSAAPAPASAAPAPSSVPAVAKSVPPVAPSRRPVEVVDPPRPAPSLARATFASMLLLDAFRPADPLAIAKMTPAVTARRARLQRYVKVVVAGCAALCLVALVRVATAAPQETGDGAVSAAAGAVRKAAVTAKTLATDEEVRAVGHEALHAAVWARRGGARHR